jgi:signal transduction histidine kinase
MSPNRKISGCELERSVQKRLAELDKTNRSLRSQIAKRKRAEEERAQLFRREKQARREAEDANRLKDEFLATVSHELRIPLNVVLGYSSMLLNTEECETSEHFKQAAETIQRNALAQVRLVSDLVNLSRLRTNKLMLDCEAISVGHIINEAVDIVHPEASTKDISFEVNLPKDSLFVYGDALRLQQILWNLLSNAVKFTSEGGRVMISLTQVLDDARLIIEDTGQGIDPKVLPYIFEMFRQAEPSTSQQHGGLGIGLALVNELVQLHRGNVEAASAGPGLGARFIVHLPLYHEV